jgi:hypothetical protein
MELAHGSKKFFPFTKNQKQCVPLTDRTFINLLFPGQIKKRREKQVHNGGHRIFLIPDVSSQFVGTEIHNRKPKNSIFFIPSSKMKRMSMEKFWLRSGKPKKMQVSPD